MKHTTIFGIIYLIAGLAFFIVIGFTNGQLTHAIFPCGIALICALISFWLR
jgi:hypothetical protein